jgi:acyl-CoA thioester hydrolase
MKPGTEPPAAFRWPVRVYFEDTDAGGVVYHATYLNFLERARTEWLRSLGFEQDRLREEQGVLFVVRRMGIEYRSSARFNDQLTVTSALSGQGRASLDFEQTVLREADASLCCRAKVNVACVDAGRMRPTRIPEAVLGAVSGIVSVPVVEAGSIRGSVSGAVQSESVDGL